MQAPARAAKLARLAAASVGMALVMLLVLRPGLPGAEVRGLGPLPACRYDDILTTPRGYADWQITLVDTILRVPKAYVPPGLVGVADLGVPGRGRVRDVMAQDLKAMSDAAAAAGNPIGVRSAYRSYAEQEAVFAGYVAQLGRASALKISARPGHSEHQLGLTVDLRSDPPVATLETSWASTPAGKWMKAHGPEYGFVMSYPKGKIGVTCYSFEPWHWRYVGKEMAASVQASGLTLREYLWANYTTTVVPPPTAKPPATPKPSATAKPPATAGPTSAPTTTAPGPTLAPGATPTKPVPTALPGPTSATPPTADSSASMGASGAPGPTAGPGPTTPPGDPASAPGIGLVAAATLGLGTIVLGSALLWRRRGRSGVGL